MAENESGADTGPQRDNESPPELSFTVKNLSELRNPSKRWGEVELPIDILLLTVNGYGFLYCYHYLREVFKSYTLTLGFVYFGEMGGEGEERLTIALMQCYEGGGMPGGASIVVPKAVETLRPKAVFCVGSCNALHRDKTRLGDVVAPAKLTTYAQREVTSTRVVPCGFTIPASRNISQLIPCAAHGWRPPLKNPEGQEVKGHSNGEILSGPEEVASISRRNELVLLYPNAVAVEMDGDGVFAAAHDLKTEWVVIKGISRYADCSSASDDWLAFANAMAASVVNNILSEPYVFEEWSHYQGSGNQTSKEPAVVQSLPRLTNSNMGGFLGLLVQTFVGKCETGQVKYEGRDIHFSARGRVHSLDELCVYDATARDILTGIEEEAHHYDTSREAIDHALQRLKERLRNEGHVRD